ncbi:hypothetical protein HZB00_04140 [Candidatus Woesearchaeota archaeon]|nr:hypothetical protein [Candidatus Woesearchaeota archaeon]
MIAPLASFPFSALDDLLDSSIFHEHLKELLFFLSCKNPKTVSWDYTGVLLTHDQPAVLHALAQYLAPVLHSPSSYLRTYFPDTKELTARLYKPTIHVISHPYPSVEIIQASPNEDYLTLRSLRRSRPHKEHLLLVKDPEGIVDENSKHLPYESLYSEASRRQGELLFYRLDLEDLRSKMRLTHS